MFGSHHLRSSGQPQSSPPSQFKENARNAIYQRLSPSLDSTANSIRSAPHKPIHLLKSLNSSVFSKRSARSAPSRYSSSTVTIPEDSEPITTTVEQLVNDIQLHESHFKLDLDTKLHQGLIINEEEMDEIYRISLGSELAYQNTPESLVDWNLNVTRCRLILTSMPLISSIPEFQYSSNALPLLVGDLAQSCQIILIDPHLTDKQLIYTLINSHIYKEHKLDGNFIKSVAEISVKQSRLLQINSPIKTNSPIISADNQISLKFKFKVIAIRNFLVNLAAAATTALEYKDKTEEIKRQLSQENKKPKLSKDEKKKLWDQVRLDVFKRAGLEE